jgi:8-oxo-dGTP diphosphatase
MGRAASSSRLVATATISVDVVLLGCHGRRLHAIVDSANRRLALPCGVPGKTESLAAAAQRVARLAARVEPQWMEQLGAFADGSSHPTNATLSVCYVAVLPFEKAQSWKAVDALSSLSDRQRRMITDGVRAIRLRLEQAPIAFFLLPRSFTLSELQQVYETLLGRRLHKASFRRALQAAYLAVPTGEWRSEGRGRPAQLYRYLPRRRKGNRRGVRLDLL